MHLDIEGDESLAVLEKRPVGALGLAALDMDEASFLDLYLGLTGPESEIPVALLQLADDNELGERGWLDQRIARGDFDLTNVPDVAAAACDPNFQSTLLNWLSSINDGSEWGLNEDPDSDADWSGPTEPLGLGVACTNCTSSWWHRDYYTDQFEVFNVDEIKLGFTACNVSDRPTITTNYGNSLPDYGPTVRFRYRTENNASTGTIYSNDIDESEDGLNWNMHWKGTSASGNNDFDWAISIANGRAADRFDVGFVWEHHGW